MVICDSIKNIPGDVPIFRTLYFLNFPIIRTFFLVPLIWLFLNNFSNCLFQSNQTNYSNICKSFEKNYSTLPLTLKHKSTIALKQFQFV